MPYLDRLEDAFRELKKEPSGPEKADRLVELAEKLFAFNRAQRRFFEALLPYIEEAEDRDPDAPALPGRVLLEARDRQRAELETIPGFPDNP